MKLDDEDVSPDHEAESLFGMVERGTETVEALRTLIVVPVRVRRILRQFGRTCPDSRMMVQNALAFRARVSKVFERLVRIHDKAIQSQGVRG